MKKISLISFLIFYLIGFSGCSQSDIIDRPSSFQNSKSEETTSSAIDPVEYVSADYLGLSGIDAALFDGAKDLWPPITSSRTIISLPYIGSFGDYTEDGLLHIVCHVGIERFEYHAESNSLSRDGSMITYGLAILEETYGTYQCVSFELVAEGASEAESLKQFCGPLTDLPEKIYNGLKYTSTFPSPSEMQSQYTKISGITFN